MATNRPFAYNPTHTIVPGTQNLGDLSIGVTKQQYNTNPGGLIWWGGPDEEQGYVIAHPVPLNTQPTPIPGVFASVGFWGTKVLPNPFEDETFLGLVFQTVGQTFSSATDASIWLTNNGYWNSYPAPVLYLDAGNVASYPGSGTTWTDIISGRTFSLINSPTYSSSNGGKIDFVSTSMQYAECNSSLPDLSTWSIGVWHYYTGTNVGIGMCLVTEVYPGNTLNLNYSLGDDNGNAGNFLSSGFFDGGWRTTNNYTLTPNNWYYIVGTYDGYTNNLYVNNTLVQSSNYVGTPISSQGGIILMRRWDNPDYWGGSLGSVAIYGKALTSSQITNIWNAQKDRYITPSASSTPTPTVTKTPTPTITTSPTQTPTNTGTPTPTPTPTGTPAVVPSGSGYDFFIPEGQPALPPQGNGNIEFFYQNTVTVTYNPNYVGGNGTYQLYFNRYATDGTDNLAAMTGLDTTGGTITMTQNGITASFSGTANDYNYQGAPNNWLWLTVTGSSQQTQIASAPFVDSSPIYVSFGTPAPTPTPSPTSVTPTPTPSSGYSPGFVVTVSQDGPNVVWSGSGSFNINALTNYQTASIAGGYDQTQALWLVGSVPPTFTSSDFYSGSTFTTYPTSFGSGSAMPPSSFTGDIFGIITSGLGAPRSVAVPTGYVSGTQLTGSMTFNSTTISGMGLTPGTYTYSWGTGGNVSTLTFIIG